jgi:hypothetical protein
MKKIITKPMFDHEHVGKTYDEHGNIKHELAVLPYCLGCLLENDGEEVADKLGEKYEIALFCKDHLERFLKLVQAVEASNN